MYKAAALTVFAAFSLLAGMPALAQEVGDPERAEQEQAEVERIRAREAEQQARATQEAVQAQARARAEVVAREAELEAARRELEQSRAQLERAAREIALSSGRLVTPEVNFVVGPGFAPFPSRAQLGLVLVDSPRGALVTRVAPGSSADEVGIAVGDVVQSIDGDALTGEDTDAAQRIYEHLGDVEAGDSVKLVVERAGQTLDFDVEAAEGPAFAMTAPDAFDRDVTVLGDGLNEFRVTTVPRNARVGVPGGSPESVRIFRTFGFANSPWGDMELVEMTEALGRYFDTDEGLLVVHAPDDEGIDIEDGDVILAISDRTPNSPEHAIRILSSFEAGETIEFSLMRDGRRRTVEYLVPEPEAMNFELERVTP